MLPAQSSRPGSVGRHGEAQPTGKDPRIPGVGPIPSWVLVPVGEPMGDSQPRGLEAEASQTVDGLFDHCDVPDEVVREAARLRETDSSLEALDVVLEHL